ncbi:MAG: EAL domain-containing protein [Saccharospirillum sp.]|nr:EAL domain-containing protein [Saccharospirillum sp.]
MSRSVNEKLAELRARYREKLLIYKSQLEAIWRDPAKTGRQIEEIQAVVHRLVGSGKAFGIPELSQRARVLELVCDAQLQQNAQEDATATIGPPLNALLQCLERWAEPDLPSSVKDDDPAVDASVQSQPKAIRLLVVDDDPDFAANLGATLAEYGYQVDCIHDVTQLREAVRHHNPMALIVDMDFYGQRFQGAEQVASWRTNDEAPLPVIFISAYESFDIRLAAVRAGGNHFLRKPVDTQRLHRILHSELKLSVIEPYRILVVDDDEDLLALYESVLTDAGYSVWTATNAEAALSVLEQKKPEMVLLDIYMPGCNGLELGRLIRQHEEYTSIPLLFMSATADTDVQLASARLANDEFISKPIEPWRLLMVVRSRVVRGRALRTSPYTSAGPESHESSDTLTGLVTMKHFRHRVEKALQQCDKHHHFAVLKVDIRDFHSINNVHGYFFGDQVLQQIAWELSRGLGPGDLLGREQSDEFLLLTSCHDSRKAVEQQVNRVIGCIDSLGGSEPFCGVSLSADAGVAIGPGDAGSADELLYQADMALFSAKKQPGAVIQYYDESIQHEERSRFDLSQSINQALSLGQFIAAYQPVLDVSTGKLCGLEALARWQHPVRGVIGPGEFIPVMEQQGIITRLTAHILTQAVAQLHHWQKTQPDLFMSVNLSAQDIHSPTFIEHLKALLDEFNVPSSSIVLEITETVLLADWQQANTVLAPLRELGVQLALDDFGTGYSSLSYLDRFHADKLKIDRSFIHNWTSTGDARLLKTMVQLGHTMEMEVIAEGVEQGRELDFLQALGCNQYQGFLTAKPMYAEELERNRWLKCLSQDE